MEAASSEMVHSSLSRYFFQGGKVIDGGIILGQLAQQFTHCDHALRGGRSAGGAHIGVVGNGAGVASRVQQGGKVYAGGRDLQRIFRKGGAFPSPGI